MKYGSVCSGIEAATVAWHSIGWAPAWFAEIEPFPCSVLAHHYPSIQNLGDMTKIKNHVLNQSAEAPDVLVGGTPCQAFSVAGMREGLDDSRGQLTLEFVRLANAIDFIRARKNQQPAIIVWENVPGVLSSKDNAFGCFLAGLAGEDSELQPSGKKWTNSGCVFGPERTIAWRTLDAQYFGLAQRRKRVFVIASARKDIDCTKILFERDSVRRASPPSRQSQQEIAATIEASLGRSRGAGTPVGGLWWNGADVADSITCTSDDQRMPDKGRFQAIVTQNNDVARCLTARGAGGQNQDPETANLIAFHPTQDPISSIDGLSHSLGCGSSHGQASVAVAYGIPGNWIGRKPENGGNATEPPLELSPCLTKTDIHAVQTQMQVRRLTPRECERLQGFPDFYTLVPHRGKPAADSPRYKALGNSMAVPVMKWIGNRIQMAVQA